MLQQRIFQASALASFCLLFLLPLAGVLFFIVFPLLAPALLAQASDASFFLSAKASFQQHSKTLAEFFLHPQTLKSTVLSAAIGLSATMLSLFFAYSLAPLFLERRKGLLQNSLSFMLSIPHAAFAIGLAFLLAPSGWLVRALFLIESLLLPASQEFQPFSYGAAYALPLVTALVMKETPFFLFIIFSASKKQELLSMLNLCRSLGYGKQLAWFKVLFGELYARIRLPLFIALSYSISVLDMSLIIGPQKPPTLSVLVYEWFSSGRESSMRFSLYGSLLLILTCVLAILIFMGIEKIMQKNLSFLRRRGQRLPYLEKPSSLFGLGAFLFLLLSSLAVILANVLWSVTRRWQAPAMLPESFTLRYYKNVFYETQIFQEALPATLLIAALSIFFSACLGLLIMQALQLNQKRFVSAKNIFLSSLYLPLLIPEISFILGLHFMFSWLFKNFDDAPYLFYVTVGHIFFTLPYFTLTLKGAFSHYDERYSILAKTLSGAGFFRSFYNFFKIKLGILKKPLLSALALAFAVSVIHYSATEVLGSGRIITVATEAVNISAGLNRRIVGLYALIQTMLPWLGFSLVWGLTRRS